MGSQLNNPTPAPTGQPTPLETARVDALIEDLRMMAKDLRMMANGRRYSDQRWVFGLAADELARLRSEVEQMRRRLYRVGRVKGNSHSTACSIWGDDGQGNTVEGWTNLPCNCGALINWERSQAEQMRRERDEAREALAQIRHLAVRALTPEPTVEP